LGKPSHDLKQRSLESSPYITRHIKRFGEYVLDVSRVPDPLNGRHDFPEGILKQPPRSPAGAEMDEDEAKGEKSTNGGDKKHVVNQS
jgi:hypothetical protein